MELFYFSQNLSTDDLSIHRGYKVILVVIAAVFMIDTFFLKKKINFWKTRNRCITGWGEQILEN